MPPGAVAKIIVANGNCVNELFYYVFKGEPVAENGFVDLKDDVPGLGLTLNTDYLEHFNIIE